MVKIEHGAWKAVLSYWSKLLGFFPIDLTPLTLTVDYASLSILTIEHKLANIVLSKE